MGWAVSADPQRFDEACDWFLKRVVLDEADALAIGTDAGRRAFWIGNGLQLTQIQRVFDEIKKANESGEPFEEWRKRVRKELTNDAHAETVFRNATQRALNAGRYEQMRDVQKWRPYWMHDSVLDSRTTEQCKRLDGVTLPADHEHWKTHWPPGHHRCRRGVRSLRKSEGEKRVTNVPPIAPSDPGFGAAPDAEPIWKPDPAKHDPALMAELKRKEGKPRKAKAAPKEAPQHHDPKHWEAFYAKPTRYAKDGYGEAASTMGWGRAMLERGLDRTPADVLSELKRLKKAGHPLLVDADLSALEGLANRPLRQETLAHLPEWRARIALSEHTRTIKASGYALNANRLPATRGAQKFYKLSLDESVTRQAADIPITFRAGARAGYSPRRKAITLGDRDDIGTAVHELAHAIEDADVRALGRSKAFLRARTVREAKKKLRLLYPNNGYRDDEEAFEDSFVDAYFGKDYGAIGATEITSMGYQMLAHGRIGKLTLADMVRKDDGELLHFLLGQLAGR